ncbi:MAG TPA: hypothetical protein VNB94_02410 [Mycobacteriales bacterium]|nr:hypothetical protein [Mycobacteriales bacterium]
MISCALTRGCRSDGRTPRCQTLLSRIVLCRLALFRIGLFRTGLMATPETGES